MAIVLLALAGSTAQSARADEPGEARHHYEAGQSFYDQGHYEEAIAEFQLAYRLKPHPNVLYNIAQAYERLLEYGKSVIYFERYLAEAEPDAEFRAVVANRLRILRNLPARVSISTIPEEARITVEGPVRQAVNSPGVLKLPAGDYSLRLEAAGWESETHAIHVEIGQPYFYQYRLKRSTSPVIIFTRPRGARVFIDDRLVGDTPFAAQVEVGNHQVLIQHPKYSWHREVINVQKGQPLRREIALAAPTRSGRTELVLASMLYGGAAGPLLLFSVAPNLNGDYLLAGLVLSSTAGLGIGFLGSFLGTRQEISEGYSSLVIGGGAWGTMAGAALGLGLDTATPLRYISALSLLGGGIGIGTAVLISHWNAISPGDAALVNSGGLWGTTTGLLLAQAIFSHPTSSEVGWFMLGGTTLGVLGGSLAAWRLERSRGHVALVDLGGLVGTGLGFVLGWAPSNERANSLQIGAQFALGGMAVGGILAAIFTRNYKGDLRPVEAFLTREGGRWGLAIPNLRLEHAITPEGSGPRLVIDLIKGAW